MIKDIEYLSAKTFHVSNVANKPIQGTGAIIASQGKFFLATALHCMRIVDDNGNEIVKPDWKKMSATIFLQNEEVSLNFIGILDIDETEDWALLEIACPDIDFDYVNRTKLTDVFEQTDTFGSYGFPHDIDDGLEMEFTPANKRGHTWRLKDITEGGSLKAITVEKGASGMGLYRMEEQCFMCLGLIHKSVPGGAFNAMKLIRAKCFAKYFPDIYDGKLECQNSMDAPIPDISQKDATSNMQIHCNHSIDNELCIQFQTLMDRCEFGKARVVIETLWEKHPEEEWVSLNFLRCVALTTPEELPTYKTLGLTINYSTQQSVIFGARSFSNFGCPEIGVEIWYNNALKFNDPELDSLYYVECLGTEFGKVVYKEYDTATEGKCVLYRDNKGRQHCVIANQQTELGRAVLGHTKSEKLEIDIAGELRLVTIVAILDKYYTIAHRALKDVNRNGGNAIIKPFKIKEGATGEEIIKILESIVENDGETPEQRRIRMYSEMPSLLVAANPDDMVGSFYRLLFTDFPLIEKPKGINDRFYNYLNVDTTFILDLSSVLRLFEHSMSGGELPKKKFILPLFVLELIKEYRRNFMAIMSYDMHQTLHFGSIHKFDDDPKTDMEMRLDAMIDWCVKHCNMQSSQQVVNLHTPNEDNRTRMLSHCVSLFCDNSNRALISDDWYQLIQLQEVPIFTTKDFIEKIAFSIIK